MSDILIGILGASGNVGRIVADILKKEFKIKAGYRKNIPSFLKDKNIYHQYVDIMSNQSLREFCCGCNVILNCAGPSYIIKDKVACAAEEVGAIYVDAYGTSELREGLHDKNICICGTGVYPGLSGIFSKYMTRFCSDEIDCYSGFAGSNEKIGRTAAIDLLNSTASCFGIANGYFENGKVKFERCDEREIYIPYNVNNYVYVNEYMNEEMLCFARDVKAKCAKWFNIVSDREYSKMLIRGYKAFINKKDEISLKNVLNEFIDKTSNVKKPWNILIVEICGSSKGEIVKKRGVIYNRSGYELSGIMSAIITSEIIKMKAEGKYISNGVYWPHEIIDSCEVIEKLRDFNIDIYIEDFEESIMKETEDEEEGVI